MIESVSRRAFGGSSGTYNVRATELARDRRLKTLSVTVVFLDDTKQLFQLEKRAKGQALLELVFTHLELVEKHYFGLQFSDNGSPPTLSNTDLMRWLDPSKPIKKQMRGPGYFYLRVKFYVSDPSKLQEEYTRYHFYLQIRKDILSGKLLVPPSTACLLASYTVQSELGDYHPDEHGPKYLTGMALMPNQTEEMEKKIIELHKLHKGQTPADAEFNFLDHAKRLDMYGVDLHRAKDSSGKDLQLGVTSNGLVIFQNGIKINSFSWGKIVKISFKRKQFFIQLKREQTDDSLVRIRMTPDEEGRFGFNVKGGSDLAMPILVSRVAPNTPADRCYPKLNEGDQVLFINGIDISGMSHEQVVNLIRASRDTRVGELQLAVRPSSVYEPIETAEEEPVYQYVTDTTAIRETLEQSMAALNDGLVTGSLIVQFDHLFRKKLGLSTSHASLPQNTNANRYTDILPYDLTRVILEGGANGDYINANYVNMEIPGSGIINRYIATQGPLANTVGGFWQMVWETGSSLIVMVTGLVERGRIKCHKYWPNIGESVETSGLKIKSTRCHYNNPAGYICNTLTLHHIQSGIEREVTQLQYIGWPDHGVPDNAAVFLQFINEVRRCRMNMLEPTVVHCSAGIGRTGVLILMETALCLIEANQPVYPIEIVTHMRDQRAMMVQTSSQFRFVCTCILHAYNEGLCKPLAEYIYC
ncbi:unnamed protein product [Nesidiocoris tenuis]|uniref:protein-tyrosine-phosphatase n=1 Tax=Nesidiocoris tenuis TaxID=355587 RepID=A0A6H5H0Q1_9HEMI|nr:unnamed protein product [Nesidiocoris tenuis]